MPAEDSDVDDPMHSFDLCIVDSRANRPSGAKSKGASK